MLSEHARSDWGKCWHTLLWNTQLNDTTVLSKILSLNGNAICVYSGGIRQFGNLIVFECNVEQANRQRKYWLATCVLSACDSFECASTFNGSKQIVEQWLCKQFSSAHYYWIQKRIPILTLHSRCFSTCICIQPERAAMIINEISVDTRYVSWQCHSAFNIYIISCCFRNWFGECIEIAHCHRESTLSVLQSKCIINNESHVFGATTQKHKKKNENRKRLIVPRNGWNELASNWKLTQSLMCIIFISIRSLFRKSVDIVNDVMCH